MKKIDNLIFLPNTGNENFYPPDKADVADKLSNQSKGDFPDITSLPGEPSLRYSSDGMVPIKNKPKR